MLDILRRIAKKILPPSFTVEIRDGRAICIQGKVTSAFLDDCTEIAGDRHIVKGWIWGSREAGGARLEFSAGIGEGDRQRFRNAAGFNRI
jgi:hypothetical protein